ncbi:DUF4179 domain-containing protein [Neobacillus muris]|uniref:DUF4179 domain-containing protein n=1 Tax=Neobacillus muris TaxID=2941334 RepID=UPI00203E1F2D|nr:DUF4179 domain-containing protein [Neobacillus muris]
MFEKEEEQLSQYRNTFENLDIPIKAIDDAILTGFQRAKLEKKKRVMGKKVVFSLTAAVLIFIGFFASIRMSPAFANSLSTIPGMEKLVDLIRTDKGKMSAFENDYYEKINISQEKNGLTFTIEGAIADENGLVIFYTLTSREKHKEIQIENVKLESANGENLNMGSSSFDSTFSSEAGQAQQVKMMEFYLQTPIKTKEFILNVRVKGGPKQEDFSLDFQIRKNIQPKKEYVLNKSITVEGQRMTFTKAVIYPLRAAVTVKMDPNNTMRLLYFDDIRLVDEQGEIWNKINNGITASFITPDEMILYLQSNYFREPKELYLVLDKIQAVNKAEAQVVVDAEKQQIIKQPKGDIFRSMYVNGENLLFSFKTEKAFNSFLFSKITDGNGQTIESDQSFMNGWDESQMTEMGVHIPNLTNQVNPVSLELSSFPSWIEGHERIRIK